MNLWGFQSQIFFKKKSKKNAYPNIRLQKLKFSSFNFKIYSQTLPNRDLKFKFENIKLLDRECYNSYSEHTLFENLGFLIFEPPSQMFLNEF